MSQMQSEERCRLADLAVGDVGKIDRFELEGAEAHRLMRLGLTPGRSVEVISTGSKCLVSAAGARLALARRLATQIVIVRLQEQV